MNVILAAVVIGVVAGMRAMTAPAAVSWAAALGRITVGPSVLGFLAHPITPWVFTVLALGEFVTDQLPTTPSRTVPLQFGTRLVTGALSGGAIGLSAGQPLAGAIAGVLGAVLGTLGGRWLRGRLAASFRNDRPAAFLEDALAVGLALLTLMSVGTLDGSRALQADAPRTLSVACSNAAGAFLTDIQGAFQQQTGHDLRFSCGLASSVRERILAGDRPDVVILTPALLDELAASGDGIATASRTLLGRSPVALAQRAGLPKRSLQTVDELQAVFAASPSIAFAQQGVSGTIFMNLLRRWDIAESSASRLRPLEDGTAVSAAVAGGDADLGVLPVSEIVSIDGIEVAGVFPPVLDAYVVMEAAAMAHAAGAPRVTAFMRFLASVDAAGSLRRHGFDPAGESR